MDPLRPGLGAADKSLGQQQDSGPLGLGTGRRGQGVGARGALSLSCPMGSVCWGHSKAKGTWGTHGWGKLGVSMGCSSHPGERDVRVLHGRRVGEAQDAQGTRMLDIPVPRLLWAEVLARLVSWQCFSLIPLPPIPPIPAFPLLPSSAHLGPSSSAVAAGVPRVGPWDLWVEMRLHKCHHSKLIPHGGGFLLSSHLPAAFSIFPSRPRWHFPSGICDCVTGMDKHLLLRCHKRSFPKILVTTWDSLCLASVTQKMPKGDIVMSPASPPYCPFKTLNPDGKITYQEFLGFSLGWGGCKRLSQKCLGWNLSCWCS